MKRRWIFVIVVLAVLITGWGTKLQLRDGGFAEVGSSQTPDSKSQKINKAKANNKKIAVKEFKRQRSPSSKKRLIHQRLKTFMERRKSLNYRRESLANNNAKKLSQSNGQAYLGLNEFFAVEDTEENRLKYPDHYSKLGHLLVEGDPNSLDYLDVVENADTGAVGVFLDEIKIKLNSGSRLEQLDLEGLTIVKNYPDIGLVIVGVKGIEEAVLAKAKLSKSGVVKRVNYEIVEVVRQPK